jgi:16S rRNA (cytosine1402-N4)-methyltransferase
VAAAAPHVPVLLAPLLQAAAPVHGLWIDATFGAGGYTRGLLEAGADHVIAIDRDPSVFAMAAEWAGACGDRLTLIEATFDAMDSHAAGQVDGVAMDLGVSSMQLDQTARGFSFRGDGPLDMRMGAAGPTAADIVAQADAATLADILYHYGEERASRRIAAAIVVARDEAPVVTAGRLARIVEGCLPRPKPGQSHPATRTFQALRIAVNDEFGQLADGLEAAERALAPGGLLAVVAFHSLEDRVVKRFLAARSGTGGTANRYAPDTVADAPAFERPARAVAADAAEVAANPRARSARLRTARRTSAPPGHADRAGLALPRFDVARIAAVAR